MYERSGSKYGLVFFAMLWLSQCCKELVVDALVIPLPVGMRTESIYPYGKNGFLLTNFYDGSVWLFDANDRNMSVVVPPSGLMALGVAESSGFVFVAGGVSRPALRVYDVQTGETVLLCDMVSEGLANDVIADDKYAYFTDSFNPVLYRLDYRNTDACAVDMIPLPVPSFEFNGVSPASNGIAFYAGGLIVTNSGARTFYYIDLQSGDPMVSPPVVYPIVPKGSLPGADGIFIGKNAPDGNSLYIAQPAANSISHWTLTQSENSDESKASTVVNAIHVRTYSCEEFDTPSAVALSKDYFVAPNFDFDAPDAWVPGLQFSIVMYSRN